jgi:hypothetical protein
VPNKLEIAADTSSWPAASTWAVDPAAAALASLIADPILVKSEDAVANVSGTTFTKEDISGFPSRRGLFEKIAMVVPQGRHDSENGAGNGPKGVPPSAIAAVHSLGLRSGWLQTRILKRVNERSGAG